MSTPGEQSPPPPPPPPSYGPPHAPPPAQQWSPGPSGYVDVDPASAGLVRQEKLGWAMPFAVIGSLCMVVALFLQWIETQLFVVYDRGTDGPLEDRRELTSLFDAVGTVEDVAGPDPDVDPGWLSGAFFPWLAIGLTVACCVLVLATAIGLRRAALTNAARIATVLLVVGAVGVAVLALYDLGLGSEAVSASPTTVSPGAPGSEPSGGSEPEFLASEVQPYTGFVLWFWGAVLVAIGGALGPRVVHKLPAGAQPAYGGAGGSGAPGWAPATGHPGLLRHTTQVVAIVLAAFATVLCVAGYGFLSWAPSGSITFSDLGESARDLGFPDQPFAEAYFAWLGWVLLLWVVVVTVLLALGKKPAGVNPRVLRPILAVGSGLALVAHLVVLGELSGDPGPAAYVVGVGLLAAVVGTLLPLRTTARVQVGAGRPFTGS